MTSLDIKLSRQLDEVVALLDVAVSPGLRTVLEARKAHLEDRAFNTMRKRNPTPRPDPATWDTLCRATLNRDNYMCRGCAAQASIFDVHHIVPLEYGGSNEPDNLNMLCKDCHKQIHPWLNEDA